MHEDSLVHVSPVAAEKCIAADIPRFNSMNSICTLPVVKDGKLENPSKIKMRIELIIYTCRIFQPSVFDDRSVPFIKLM